MLSVSEAAFAEEPEIEHIYTEQVFAAIGYSFKIYSNNLKNYNLSVQIKY